MTSMIKRSSVRKGVRVDVPDCRVLDQNRELQSDRKELECNNRLEIVAPQKRIMRAGDFSSGVRNNCPESITKCCSCSRLHPLPSIDSKNSSLPIVPCGQLHRQQAVQRGVPACLGTTTQPHLSVTALQPSVSTQSTLAAEPGVIYQRSTNSQLAETLHPIGFYMPTLCIACQNLCTCTSVDCHTSQLNRQSCGKGNVIIPAKDSYFSNVASPINANCRQTLDENSNDRRRVTRSVRGTIEDDLRSDCSSRFLQRNITFSTLLSKSKSTSLRHRMAQNVARRPQTKCLHPSKTCYLVDYFLGFLKSLVFLFLYDLPSSLRTSSSSAFCTLMLHFLVWLTVLPNSSLFTTAYPPHKYSPDAYGLWDRSLILDDVGHYQVQWTASSTDIQFRLTVRTRGYIGFGLSSQSKMDGADIVVGWVHSGKAYLQDRHGLGNLEPAVDRFQDWTIVSGYENDTHTVLHVSRPLNTCDPLNDHVISNDTSRVLWAYHPDDPVDPDSPRPRLHYHGDFRRGARSVFLLDRDPGLGYGLAGDAYDQNTASYTSGSSKDKKEEESEIHTWTLNSPGVEVKGDMATIYWCKLFRKPLLVQKNHIIKFEPIFSAGNERHVHHIVVSECTSDDPSVVATMEQLADSSGGQCYSNNMVHLLKACSHVVVAWAVGSKGLTLPPETGYPLSPNGPSIFLMQIHYDNPDNRHFQDHSGIRVHYTHKLRNFDAGVLSVGLEPIWKHLIPPGQASVLSSGHCVSECTAKALPATGIQVFGAVVQTHLLGQEVRLRHIRNGVELDPIAQDMNYDYSYLEYRLMKEPRTVLPGDHLISECKYSSLERTVITLGGINTRDEMCLSYLYYWPRSALSLCHSKPSLNTVLQSLGIEELSHDSDIIKIRKPLELAGKTLEWRLVNYDWEFQFENFQRTTHTGTFNPMCHSRGHSLLPTLEEVDYEYPNISEPWFAEDTCRRPQWPHSKETNPHHRRQRPHHRRQHPHPAEGLQDEAQGEPHTDDHLSGDGSSSTSSTYDGGDVMFDDDISSKPIKRIDADPVRKFDVFMPIREDTFDGKAQGGANSMETQPGSSGGGSTRGVFGNSGRTVNTRNRTPFQDLREEFDAMERDLEQEVNHNRLPDSFQERTAHNPRANSAFSLFSAFAFERNLLILVVLTLYHNTTVLSRLKNSLVGC
ncbi:Copper type II ascorbate-dependent monooxygenase C-terminal [Trinorchestia longiramus]|nr:Copper type II ascorbate-dependent monooxygenase C-terminal [Trinorchestia longiramus]